MTAWVNGFIGLASLAGIGHLLLDWTLPQIGRVFGASLLAGTIALFGILKAERFPAFRRIFMGRPLKVWVLFSSAFFGQVFLYAPELRPWLDLRAFALQLVPIMLSNGFTIVLFGPVQDRLVWRRQRLERQENKKAAGAGRPAMVKEK
jgi:hypothetical protein